ncbi:MAG: hypothetical protein IJ255_06005, partial [Bacteroidales bacterium]|nr:hypothetical protein [Bacteroidales bacterium]
PCSSHGTPTETDGFLAVRFSVGVHCHPPRCFAAAPEGACGLRSALGRRLHCIDFFEISLAFRRGG